MSAFVATVALLLYVFTLSVYGSWLDAGEFVASAITVGITHPPGHPLHSIWAGAFAILPLGTVSLRVALSSAAAAAAGVGVLSVLCYRVLSFAELSRLPRLVVAALTSLCVAVSPALWAQATRPEVYALQFLLSMIALERLMHALVDSITESESRRALYAAAFVWGLSLCNHHLIAFLLLPAALVALPSFPFAVGARAVGLACIGLMPYLYLPLRAARSPIPNFGEPSSLGRFIWLVSAKAFQKNTGSGVPEPIEKRAFDVLTAFEGHFTIVGVFLALAGLYFLLRSRMWRGAGVVLGLVVLLSAGARIWLGHTANNPDALGYLATGLAVASVLAACFVSLLLRTMSRVVQEKRRQGTSAGQRAVAGAVMLACALPVAASLFPLWRGPTVYAQQNLRDFRDTDSWDDVAFRRAPANSILILHDPETIFRALQFIAEYEVPASDLLVVPTPFLAYPGMIESLARQEPLLRPALTSYALSGSWEASLLQSLSSSRSLLMEMDPYLSSDVIQTLVPNVFFFEVLSSEAYPEDREAALLGHARGHEHLQRLVQEHPRNHFTRARLLIHHYNDALYFAAVGQVDAAKEAAARALALSPDDRELRRLDRALEMNDGPLELAPFVPDVQR